MCQQCEWANNTVPFSQRCSIERAINFSMKGYRCWGYKCTLCHRQGVKLFYALFVHEHGGGRTIFWEVWQNILDISCATYIETTRSHAWARGQSWSKLSEVVLTCNLSLRPFSFLILLHQSCKMCNVVYSFICSVWRMSMSLVTWDNYHLVRSRH
jgi:hypothetical protein